MGEALPSPPGSGPCGGGCGEGGTVQGPLAPDDAVVEYRAGCPPPTAMLSCVPSVPRWHPAAHPLRPRVPAVSVGLRRGQGVRGLGLGARVGVPGQGLGLGTGACLGRCQGRVWGCQVLGSSPSLPAPCPPTLSPLLPAQQIAELWRDRHHHRARADPRLR